MCGGAVLMSPGKAGVTAVWEDPKTQASVTAEMKEPGKHLKITYVGDTYVAWLKRTREADVKSKL